MTQRDEYFQVRAEKVERLREQGIDPFPARYRRTHTIAQALELLARWTERGRPARERSVSVTGRVTGVRNMGRVAFLDLRDGTGAMQAQLRRDLTGADFELLKSLDLGDFLGVRGRLIHTRTGEPTVEARSAAMLGKALRPPPEKWHGLQDVQQRLRQREADLIANDDVRERFVLRSKLVAAIRRFMDGRGYLEVETPILLNVAAGANARPFVTQHNALSRTLYLRIATELHLKRCIIGGLDRVYEIGRIFRNEGLDATHNPEFTSMESYEAYADYNDIMSLVETMVEGLASELLGTTTLEYGGATIDVKAPWRRLDLRTAILEHAGIDIDAHRDAASLAGRMREIGVVVTQEDSWGRLVDKLLGDKVEPHLVQPTFLVDYPVEMTPLAKRHPSKGGYVERFEGFVAGMEVCNAFTELNDPIEQRRRFEEQEALRVEHAEEDFDRLDEDFLTAVEYGMPPTGGLGVGIDRLAMLFSGQSTVREVVLFPHLSLSQDEMFRAVDAAIQEVLSRLPTLSQDAFYELVRNDLSAEVAARITKGELIRRAMQAFEDQSQAI
ncbi:MAG: lysine--tRNA ligase [Chloroflexota bacterium]|nr:lysine--tRNA ligase [Chloroflexota bacterium]MDE2969749.1 lysine--tRNA ligase [Chloroflexota bacterium]